MANTKDCMENEEEQMKQKKAILLAVLVFTFSVILCGCGNKKIDMNQFVTYEIAGTEGYGYVDTHLDEDAFAEAICEAKGIDLNSEEAFAIYVKASDLIYEGSWDKEKGLSNGDTITYSFNLDDKKDKAFDKISLTYKEITATVEGLEDVEVFNPFDDIEVSFSGVSGQATLNIKDEIMNDIAYIPDKRNGLSEGDIVTIKTDVTDLDAYVARNGRIPDPLSMEYKVEGLDSYVLTKELLNSEVNLKKINNYVKLTVEEYGRSLEPSIYMRTTGIYTGSAKLVNKYPMVLLDDPEIVELYYGNNKKDTSTNLVYIIVRFPFELDEVTPNGESKGLVKGDTFLAIPMLKSLVSNDELVIGDTQRGILSLSQEKVLLGMEQYKDRFNIENAGIGSGNYDLEEIVELN